MPGNFFFLHKTKQQQQHKPQDMIALTRKKCNAATKLKVKLFQNTKPKTAELFGSLKGSKWCKSECPSRANYSLISTKNSTNAFT